MAESLRREKLKRRNKVDKKSCVTPAGTSNELDVQNEREENTHTHTYSITVGFSPTLYCCPNVTTIGEPG